MRKQAAISAPLTKVRSIIQRRCINLPIVTPLQLMSSPSRQSSGFISRFLEPISPNVNILALAFLREGAIFFSGRFSDRTTQKGVEKNSSMRLAASPLRIGVSASLVHAGTHPGLALGLPCLVMLESLAHWIMSRGDLSFLIPTQPGPEWNAPSRVLELVDHLDALVLQGGADVCPRNYGEQPRNPEWCGDPRRDEYELALIREFLHQRKPILGVCRGMQLLNVAMGGSLVQDIPQERPSPVCHRDLTLGAHATHEISFTRAGVLEELYQGRRGGQVVSVHHQAVKRLGQGLVVEAVSPEDQLIEAIRLDDDRYFAWGVQWHPEIQPPGNSSYLDPGPILEHFRQAALQRSRQARRLQRRAG